MKPGSGSAPVLHPIQKDPEHPGSFCLQNSLFRASSPQTLSLSISLNFLTAGVSIAFFFVQI